MLGSFRLKVHVGFINFFWPFWGRGIGLGSEESNDVLSLGSNLYF